MAVEDEAVSEIGVLSRIEALCAEKGLRMTEPRRVIARVLSDLRTIRTPRSCTIA